MTELFALVLILVATGYALRKSGLVPEEAGQILSTIVIWLPLPLLIVTSLQGAPLTGEVLVLPALAWGLSLGAVALGWLMARMLGLGPLQTGAFVLALAFGNTTFLGYPLIQGFYPPPAPHLALAILYDQLGATFAVNTLGAGFASLQAGQWLSPARLLRRLLLFPPVWALALALVWRSFPPPEPALTLALRIGGLTVPLMLLSMGLSIRLGRWRESGGLVLLVAVLKLGLLPLAMWGAVSALGLPPAEAQTAVLEAAMPTMFYALTLALAFGLESVLVVNAIVLTTALSLVTVPAWKALLG